MKAIYKYLIQAGVVIVILLFVFMIGCNHGKKLVQATIQHDTTYVHDTVTHIIPNDIYHYVTITDTVIKVDSIPVLPTKEDTANILSTFYAKHYYTSVWNDSLLQVTQRNMVSENIIHPLDFKYKYLGSTTVIQNIDNSRSYAKYIDLGLTYFMKDYKYSDIWLSYKWQKASLGIGYAPFVNSFTVHGGITILKFK